MRAREIIAPLVLIGAGFYGFNHPKQVGLWMTGLIDTLDPAKLMNSVDPRLTAAINTLEPDTSPEKTMSASDLKRDISDLDGRRIEVSGQVRQMASFAYLSAGPFDSSSVQIDVDNLPRDQRNYLADSCQQKECSGVTVRGLVHSAGSFKYVQAAYVSRSGGDPVSLPKLTSATGCP